MELLTLKQLKAVISKERKDQKVVFASGVFDLFHFGHFIALKKASLLGDIFIVQVDGNNLVKKRKGLNRPYFSQKKRARMISALSFVDYVYISNIPSESRSILNLVKPDIFVRASRENESNATRRMREKNMLRKHSDMKIVWLKETREVSTTKLVKLLESDIMMRELDKNYSKKFSITPNI